MAITKHGRTKKHQALSKENPVGEENARQRKPARRKANRPKAMPKQGIPSARRMALVKIEPAMSQEMIAVAAYYKAEKRGFLPGGEIEDWLEAEEEIFGFSSRV